MNFSLLVLSIIALIVFQESNVFAQGAVADPLRPGQRTVAIYWGPVLGYNRSLHSTDLVTFEDEVPCPVFKSGSANGFHVGLFYEHIIGDVGSQHSIVGRVLYNTLPAKFKEGDQVYPYLVRDHNDNLVTRMVGFDHTNEVAYDMFSLDLMYKFRAVDNFVITIGPSFDYVFTHTQDQKFVITTPDDVQFIPDYDNYPPGAYSDDWRTLTVTEGDIPEATNLRFAIKFGAQYEIITGRFFDIIPGIFYNYSLTDVTDAIDWKVNALQFSVDFRIRSSIRR